MENRWGKDLFHNNLQGFNVVNSSWSRAGASLLCVQVLFDVLWNCLKYYMYFQQQRVGQDLNDNPLFQGMGKISDCQDFQLSEHTNTAKTVGIVGRRPIPFDYVDDSLLYINLPYVAMISQFICKRWKPYGFPIISLRHIDASCSFGLQWPIIPAGSLFLQLATSLLRVMFIFLSAGRAYYLHGIFKIFD